MLQWTLVYKYLFEFLFSVLLGIHLEVESLGHLVYMFSLFNVYMFNIWFVCLTVFNFLRNYTAFCSTHTIFTFLLAVHKGSDFSIASLTLVIFCFFFFFNYYPSLCEMIPLCILAYIFLMINNIGHLFMCLLATCIFSLAHVCSSPLPF